MTDENNSELNRVTRLKNKENYQLWDFEIQIHFESSNILNVVNGSTKKPIQGATEENTVFEIRLAEWNKCDAMGRKFIVSTVDKSILLHLMTLTTEHDMFIKLKELFGRAGPDLKCTLLKEFFSKEFKQGSKLMDHVSELQNLYSRLQLVEAGVDEQMLISKILTTLPDRLNNLVLSWEIQNKTEQKLTDLIERLQAEDNKEKSSENESIAFIANRKFKCYKCGNDGHKMKFCRSSYDIRKDPKCEKCNIHGHKTEAFKGIGTKGAEKRWCSTCRMNNHTNATCRKTEKLRQGSPNNDGDSTVCFYAANGTTEDFVVDSGSSSHLV
ncbi:uncharacterized protein [Bemisia tabaci]|uniref:uncharacterized protein isoform X1 n=1 Tax=Bemisia tabaci TaxID=7038 RepID=UPI003B28C60B